MKIGSPFQRKIGLKQTETIKELMERRCAIEADIYQVCGTATVHYLEMLCRQRNGIIRKLHSLKGGIIYGED